MEQLEHLIHAEPARADGEGPGPARPGRPTAPGYYSEPTYGQGPAQRSMGPVPVPPRVGEPGAGEPGADDLIDLTRDGEAEVLLSGSWASAHAQSTPVPPPRHPPSRASRRIELILLIAVVIVACTIIAALLRLSS